jgi:chromosome segregation ATPase
MPRKKYDNDKLKAEMVELRRHGYSYRQIAQKLGCSTFKVYDLLSPHESPSARLKQAADLADRLDKLEARAKILEEHVTTLERKLAKLNVLETLQAEDLKLNAGLQQLGTRLSKLEEKLTAKTNELHVQIQRQWDSNRAISQKLSGLEEALSQTMAQNDRKILDIDVKLRAVQDTSTVRYLDFANKLTNIENALKWIRNSCIERVEGRYTCRHIDEEGYCKRTRFHEKIEGYRTKQIVSNDQKLYILNVRDNPLICIACPSYKPK